MADILNALNAGGFPLMQFVMIILLWRELVRSRLQCESQIKEMQAQQIKNVEKIATLEGQIQMLSRATFNYNLQTGNPQGQPQTATPI